MIFFSHPYWLLLLPVLLLLIRSFRNRQYLPMSSANLVRSDSGVKWIAKTPNRCFIAMLVCVIVALAGPQRYQNEATDTIMGRDIVVAVDISGSMGAPIPKPQTERPKGFYDLPTSPYENKQAYRRIDAAQDSLMQFVNAREEAKSGDRVGLFLFDDSPRLAWPLTHDLRQIGRKSN